eukprot:8292343-Alexandrium_andersonii.AAC.1
MPHASALHCLAFMQLAEIRRLAPSRPRPRRRGPAQGLRPWRTARRHHPCSQSYPGDRGPGGA